MAVSRSDRVRRRISRTAAYQRARDLVMVSGRDTYWIVREDLARRYLRGEGIEIGALTAPLRVPPHVDVRYVDWMSRDQAIAEEGPSLAAAGVEPGLIVEVDSVQDAEHLGGIGDDSVDFVIAAQVLEHLEDPVEGLINMLRVVRPGGTVLIVLPDPRFTFDVRREPTPVEHVVADHVYGPAVSRAGHHIEWARDIEGLSGQQLDQRAAEFAAQDARHHFHVWRLGDFLALLPAIRLPCEILHAQAYAKEFAVVLEVTARPIGRRPVAPARSRSDDPKPVGPPPNVTVQPRQTVLSYTRARLRQHTRDSYAGVPLSKFPEDLRVYEHLLWLADPDVVIELGAQFGASSLWFRDRLDALAGYRPGRTRQVISVDVDLSGVRRAINPVELVRGSKITMIEASVTDPALPDRIAALIEPEARCMVIEDTAHVYETTIAALNGFARFVPLGGFFVVEDGCVDVEELRIDEHWPRGALPALHDWLATDQGAEFAVRTDLELYGVTCHPGGFLQRRRTSPS